MATALASYYSKEERLCIPSVPLYVTRESILATLSSLNVGRVYSVREIPFTRGNSDARRITFRVMWNNHKCINEERLQNMQKRIRDGQTVRIVYEFPKFWELRSQMPSSSLHQDQK